MTLIITIILFLSASTVSIPEAQSNLDSSVEFERLPALEKIITPSPSLHFDSDLENEISNIVPEHGKIQSVIQNGNVLELKIKIEREDDDDEDDDDKWKDRKDDEDEDDDD